MYSIDLSKISLDDFKNIILSIDLLPGRRVLLENLPRVIEHLQGQEILDLEALRKRLQSKKNYHNLAETICVSVEYLTVLNREINSYVSKPISLAELGVFSDDELERLGQAGIKSTKDFYEQSLTPLARSQMEIRLLIPAQRILQSLWLADLLRINGVGPVYAKILVEIGIHSVEDYLRQDSGEILENYRNFGAGSQTTRASLGLKDVEYCKRFCRLLTTDIEW